MLVINAWDQSIFPDASELFVDENLPISDGDAVVAVVGDTLMCRRAYRVKNGYRLTHPGLADVFASKVIGRVVRYAILA